MPLELQTALNNHIKLKSVGSATLNTKVLIKITKVKFVVSQIASICHIRLAIDAAWKNLESSAASSTSLPSIVIA